MIIFRVNAETKKFSEIEAGNNHFVALHFNKETNKITYIDPTGEKYSDEIKQKIVQQFDQREFDYFGAVLQYTNPTYHGDVYVMGRAARLF